MALSLSIDLCLRSNCNQLVFKETTGAYSASNTGGWGAPNPTTAAATSAVLTATSPSGVIYTINLLTLSAFPKSDINFEYVIPLAQLGSVTSIADGYWTFTYTVVASAVTYTDTFAKTFTCAIDCCISNILMKIKNNECETCDSNYYTYEEYVKAISLRDSLENATECGDTEYIEDILEILQRLCNKTACKTCN